MDVKNTKEVIVAANEIALEAIKLFKDGAQVADVMQLVSDLMGPLRDKVMAGVADVKEVGAEIKDIDAMEVVELVNVQVSYVPLFIAALKK